MKGAMDRGQTNECGSSLITRGLANRFSILSCWNPVFFSISWWAHAHRSRLLSQLQVMNHYGFKPAGSPFTSDWFRGRFATHFWTLQHKGKSIRASGNYFTGEKKIRFLRQLHYEDVTISQLLSHNDDNSDDLGWLTSSNSFHPQICDTHWYHLFFFFW